MERTRELVISGITKDFAGLRALNDVSLQLAEGEILGLIGPNGSGKTTLINVITGLLPATAGHVSVEGTDITNKPAFLIARHGIARTFQTIRLFRELTVVENVQVAAVSMGLSRPAALRRAEAVLEELVLSDWSRAQGGSLALRPGAAGRGGPCARHGAELPAPGRAGSGAERG